MPLNRLLGFAICLAVSTCLLPGVFAQSTPVQEAWKLEKDKKGIRVYSRHVANTRIKEIRVNCDLHATLPQLVAYISDISHYKETVYNCVDAYVVQRINDRDFYFYLETDMPWPVANRDMVVRMMFIMDPNTRILSVRATNAEGMVPEKKGLIRIPHWHATWTIRELDKNRLRVEYLFGVDPGGELPSWLVNSLIANGPYQSFSNIEALLKRPYYQNRTFSFLQQSPGD